MLYKDALQVDRSYYDGVLRVFAGGIAGCCAKTTVAPFDRTKILLQGHRAGYSDLSPFHVLRRIRTQEGFLGWYQGNGAQMVRIFPYSGIQFLSYDIYKRLSHHVGLEEWLRMDVDKLLCGALAGMTAAASTYPLDIIRANLAFQSATENAPRPRQGAIVRTARDLVQRGGGALALYRGLGPTLLGMAPYAGISFYTFERLKGFVSARSPPHFGLMNADQSALSVPGRLLCGSVAGLAAQTIAYPLDVARRNMQLSTETAKSARHWLEVLMRVLQRYGVVKGLYRGLSLNYLRCLPMVSVSFTVYETLCERLGILRR